MASVKEELTKTGYKILTGYKISGLDEIFVQKTTIVCICDYKDIDQLLLTWEEAQDAIATDLQPHLENKHRWDIYLLLVVNGSIPEEQIANVQKIEDDVYCCRKIIVENVDKPTLKKGIVQLPYIELESNEMKLPQSVRDNFFNRLSRSGFDRQLLEGCAGLDPNEVAERLIKFLSKRNK